jgi:hypothetical protein
MKDFRVKEVAEGKNIGTDHPAEEANQLRDRDVELTGHDKWTDGLPEHKILSFRLREILRRTW